MTEGNDSIEAPKPRRLRDIPRKVWKVNMDPVYDEHLTPQEYEKIVNSKGSRERLGQTIAEVIEQQLTELGISNPRVLDVAAGTGLISKSLENKDFQTVALDLSEKLLQHLRNTSTNIHVVRADMNNESLPFPDDSFDAATTVFANRFISDSAAFSREIARVLKPGGVFVWPTFYAELPWWKLRAGIRQPATAKALAAEVSEWFSEVKTFKPGALRTIRRGIAYPQIPAFIIAKK